MSGFYTCVYLDKISVKKLNDTLYSIGIIPNTSFPYHVTIISSLIVPNTKMIYNKPISIKTTKFSILGENNCLVLNVESEVINKLHSYYVKKGAVHIHDSFKPHITISECGSFNFNPFSLNLNLIGKQSSFSSLIL